MAESGPAASVGSLSLHGIVQPGFVEEEARKGAELARAAANQQTPSRKPKTDHDVPYLAHRPWAGK